MLPPSNYIYLQIREPPRWVARPADTSLVEGERKREKYINKYLLGTFRLRSCLYLVASGSQKKFQNKYIYIYVTRPQLNRSNGF